MSMPTKGIARAAPSGPSPTAASASTCCPATSSSRRATDPEAGRQGRRGRRRQPGGDGRRRGRLSLRAVARGGPRLFFEDLELPDLVKMEPEGGQDLQAAARRLHGRRLADQHQCRGAPCATAYGRRIALHRPKRAEMAALRGRDRRARRRAPTPRRSPDGWRPARGARQPDAAAHRHPLSRPGRHPLQPLRAAAAAERKAVMFCLMDVSGSMGEREKDLAKRFFVLLHLFLKRRYDRIDIVFIRHTHEAREVDEETFFYSTQSGGTVVSTALEEMQRIIAERYPSQRVEHLRRAGLGRRQQPRRLRALRRAAEGRLMQALPVLRLCRDHRRARDGIFGDRERHRALARLQTVGEEWPNFQMTRIARPERHLSGFPPALRQAAGGRDGAGDRMMRKGRTDLLFRRPRLEFRDAGAHLRRHRGDRRSAN